MRRKRDENISNEEFLAGLPAIPESKIWPADMMLELALGLEPDYDIIERYGVSLAQYALYQEHPTFKKELAELRKKVFEEGLTFTAKASAQVEEYLKDMHDVMKSKYTPPNVKVDLFKTLAKLAGKEPKEEKAQVVVNNNNQSITNLIQAVQNTSRDLIKPDIKEIRAKSWKE